MYFGTQKYMYARKQFHHEFEEKIDKSVLRVTVWHHSEEPCDAKKWPSRQNCLSYRQTHDIFLYDYDLHCLCTEISV